MQTIKRFLGRLQLAVIAFALCLSIIAPVLAQANEDDASNIKNSSDDSIVKKPTEPEQSRYDDLPTVIVTMIFVCISSFEYILYFILYLYVFLFVVIYARSFPRGLFAFVVMIIFIATRLILSPLILNVIPLQWRPSLPETLTTVSTYVFCITYFASSLLTMGAVIYIMIKYGYKGDKIKSGIIHKPTGEVPMVVIMMPIYNEEPIPLFRAVESAVRSDYPKEKMHVFLGFDDDSESQLYLSLLKKLRVLNKDVQSEWKNQLELEGISEGDISLFPPRLELMVEGVRLTICRFPHGGKSACQGQAYKIVDELYGQDPTKTDQTLLLYIDSDIILHENALYNFVSVLIAKPKMQAVTGIITCRTSEEFNMIQFLQDIEYLDGQLFGRGLESVLGSVTCLPGALTCLRLSAMQKVAPLYFREFEMKKSIDFHRFYLGEDRFMTHLLMEITSKAYSIGICGASRCKTDAPDSWTKLIKQRRRWYLAFVVSEISMLVTPSFWLSLPFLMIVRFFDFTAVSLSWLTFVYIISAAKGQVEPWTLALFVPSLVIKYLILSFNAGIMNRYKVIIYFPIYFLVFPVFKLFVTAYSLYAWDTRSWGGPRADAGVGDIKQAPHPLSKVDDLMAQKDKGKFINKRVMRQVKRNTRHLSSKLTNEKLEMEDLTPPQFIDHKTPESFTPSLKNLIPFPYKVDVLGGGEYYTDLIYPENLHQYILPEASEEEWRSGNSTQTGSINGSQSSLASRNSIARQNIDPRYLYGKYSQANPFSSTSSLDLHSLAKIEKLTYDSGGRSQSPGAMSPSSSLRNSPPHPSSEASLPDSQSRAS